MNRILFVGLCLVGMIAFALSTADKEIEKQPKVEVTKESAKPMF